MTQADPLSLQTRAPRNRWRLWALLALAALAAVLGPGRAWHAYRTGPERCYRAGLAAFAAGDADAVQAAAEGLRGVVGREPHLHLLEGMVLLRRGRLIEAIQEFGHAKDHPETEAQAHLLSGEALYRGRQFRDAERVLAKAAELDPALTDAHRWLAALYYDIGAMPSARKELEVVAEQAPDDPRPARLRGLIFKDLEMFAEAIPEFRESLRRDPDQPDADDVRFELAECLVKVGQPAEAIEVLRESARSARALTLDAECRHALGDAGAARRQVEEALHMAPQHLEALLLAATVRIEAGETGSAVEALETALKHHPKDWRARFRLAPLYERLGRKDDARREARTGKELRDQLARFSQLHQAAIRSPGDATVRYRLGVAARELDKHDLARSWFAAALAMDPSHADARKALEEMDRNRPAGRAGP